MREILEEFSRWSGHPNPPRLLQTVWYDTDAMAQEIQRLRTRVAWLENEIDHIDGVIGAATAYIAAVRQDKAVAHQAYQHLADAVKTYWEEDLDDDGTEL